MNDDPFEDSEELQKKTFQIVQNFHQSQVEQTNFQKNDEEPSIRDISVIKEEKKDSESNPTE